MVTVADNGSGMDRHMFERLFHPFVTTKGEAGTGLGLWVSKGILDKHDARVSVRSRSGSGTVFRIFFPVAAQADSSASCSVRLLLRQFRFDCGNQFRRIRQRIR